MDTSAIFLRGMATAFVISMGFWAVRSYRNDQAVNAFLLVLIGVAGYLLAPVFTSGPIHWVAVFGASLIPPGFYFLATTVFEAPRIPALARWHWGLIVVIYQGMVFGSYVAFRQSTGGESWVLSALFGLAYLAKLVFIAGALGAILRHWQTDLVASRRRFRWVLTAMTGVYIVAVVLVELGLWGQPGSEVLENWNACLLAVVTGAFSLCCWHTHPRELFPEMPAAVRTESADPTRAEALRLADQQELSRLEHLMTQDQVYRQSELSIAVLADLVQVPEHRLRRLINQHLGYRNYNDYLNFYRINEAATRLSSVDCARVPILTIAYDLGFGSIAPFNRAFKARFDVTPTVYRNRALSATHPQ